MLVQANCELSGQTIQDAGLRHLPGLFLIETVRNGDIIPVVSPQTVIQSGDRLVFAGAVDSVVELRRIRGLAVASDQVFKLEGRTHERRLFEAVISVLKAQLPDLIYGNHVLGIAIVPLFYLLPAMGSA